MSAADTPPPPQPVSSTQPQQPVYAAPPPPPPAYGYANPYGAAYANPYGQPPRRSRWWIWAIVAVVILGVLIGLAVLWASAVKSLVSDNNDNNGFATVGSGSIAVIDISGVIVEPDKIDKELEKFGKDSSVKAILLHINSPGGGAAASQEIYHEVLRVREQDHKKVYASVESVGASGAYYIASACDKIYANEASVVGSIGVIMEWTNYGGLMQWAKLQNITISKGALKDAGDPTRPMTPQEQVYFQGLVDNMYGQFVHDVAAGRHTTPEKILPLATGQVWTGEEALPLGLIDAEGGYRDALLALARSVGIHGEPHIVRPARPNRGLLALLDGDSDEGNSLFANPLDAFNRAPGFYFLWK